MIEPIFRPFFQQILGDPIAHLLGKVLSPNTLTLLSLLTGMAIVPALIYKHTILALIVLCLSGFLDMIDGTVARLMGKSTPFGTALDITCDRIVEFAIVLGLFLISPEVRSLDCIFMLGSILICITTFLVVGIFSNNDTTKSFYYSSGIIERPEAFIFFIGMILLPDYFHALSLIFSFLVCLTATIRMIEFRRSSSTPKA